MMTEVSAIALPGLPYARVRTTESYFLYVPLFLAEQAEFERLVAQCAGRGHPLVTFLANRADDDPD